MANPNNDPTNALVPGEMGSSDPGFQVETGPVASEEPKAANGPELTASGPTLNSYDGSDPLDALGDALTDNVDIESNIYSPQRLFGQVSEVVQQGLDTAQGVSDFVTGPDIGNALGGFVEGLQGTIEGLPIDESGSTQQLLSDTVGGIGQASRAIAGGVAEAGVETANLLDDILTSSTKAAAKALLGDRADQFLKDNPALSQVTSREIPEWLKPQGTMEEGLHTLAQWYGPFKGLGLLGKTQAVAKAMGATSLALEGVPGLAKLSALSSEAMAKYPKIQALVKATQEGLSFQGKDFVTDLAAFDGHTENLANVLADVTGDNPLLGRELWKSLQNDEDTDDLQGRFHTALISQFGTSVGGMLFSGIKTLKALKAASGELKTLKDEARLKQLLGDIDTHSNQFQAELDAMTSRDPQEVLNEMFPSGTSMELASEGTSVGLSEAPKSVRQKKIELLPTDDVSAAASKILDNQEPLPQDQVDAIRQMLTEKLKQTNAQFDEVKFQKTVDEALKNGTPIDIHEEIINAIPDVDLQNIDAFKEQYQKVVNSTLRSVKRYVSHEEAANRALSIFGFDPGVETTTKALHDMQYVRNTQNALKIQMKVLENKTFEAALLYGQAIASKAGDAIEIGLHNLSSWWKALHNTTFQYDQIGSEMGRAFNERNIEITEEQAMAAAASAIRKKWEAGKANLPIHLTGGDELSKEEANLLAAAAMDFNKVSPDGPSGWQKAAKFTSMFVNSAMGRLVVGLPTGTITGAASGAINTSVAGSIIGGVGGAIGGAVNNPQNPLGGAWQGAKVGAMAGFNTGWVVGGVGGAAVGGSLGLMTGTKGLRYTLGAAQEIFYNNVLAHYSTLKAIGFNNLTLKAYEQAGSALGALSRGDFQALQRTGDEAAAFAQYMGEGIMGSLGVFAKGERHPLDYASSHPRVLSKDGLRQYFGATAGEALQGTPFAHFGNFSDGVVDAMGRVVNMPTGNFIGGVDTIFKIANARAILSTELLAKARYLGMDNAAAHIYKNTHIDTVTHDLISGRALKFKGATPTQTIFNSNQLSALNKKIIGSTDQFSLSHPLKHSESPYVGATRTNSDRWVFKVGASVDELARYFGIAGTFNVPFAKTFINSAQYGIDSMPIFNMLDPHNQSVWRGDMGREAQDALRGKTFMGAALALMGCGAAMNGMLTAPSGSAGAKKSVAAITGLTDYGLSLPLANTDKRVTLDFGRMNPISDLFFLPGRMLQLAHEMDEGHVDFGPAGVSAIALGMGAFGVNRSLRGTSVNVDALLNPTYSTADSIMRNVVIGGAGTILYPGGRAVDNINMFTDPDYRDYHDLKSYVLSKTPLLSNTQGAMYDPFGVPRPRNDYMGATESWASNLTRAFTPLGFKYVVNDPVAKEIERFGVQGMSLTPPTKNVSYEGVTFALDTYRNDKGESLWDAYNKELREIKVPGPEGKQTAIRDWLNEFIHSDEYKNVLQDNTISRETGKTNRFVGSRWARIASMYSDAKTAVVGKYGILFSKPEYLNDYRDTHGDSIMSDLEKAKTTQTQSLMQPPQPGVEQ